jgi:ribonuclease J
MTVKRQPLSFSAVAPTSTNILYVPLGGTGEIGMNLNLYGHAGQWLMADCGMMMDRDGSGDELILPDPSFIEAHRSDLAGIVLTHAHMDHIGALAWLWPSLGCPLYATRYTAAVIMRELSQRMAPAALEGLDLQVVELGGRRQIGPFDVEFVTLTHSIPEPSALVIRTAAGTVFHTGDWKLDATPVVGPNYDQSQLERLGREGIDCLVGDSTNANVPGTSGSESSLLKPLTDEINRSPHRVVVTCFASNVARLITLGKVAKATGRRLVVLGRGLEKTVGIARSCGYWDEEVSVVPGRHGAYLPREEVLAVATGSQGEGRAALARLGADTHHDLDLQEGDKVIFSARNIPGNEDVIARVIANFQARNIDVVEHGAVKTHVSGHPHADELRTLYGWLKPRLVVPTHGEAIHLAANAEVARTCGVPVTLDARNGDVCQIAGGQLGILGAISSGRLMVERDAVATRRSPAGAT